MYAESLSLVESVQGKTISEEENVLHSFPSNVGREVVSSVIRPLQELVLGKNFGGGDTPLSLPQQVQWTMEILGHGLTLPLSELPLIQGCVDVYHDWLSALYFQKHTVPLPILKDPNHYVCIIFDQLCSLFVPREAEPRYLEDHAYLCKKVMEVVHTLMSVKGLKMTRETWESLFGFMLHVCDVLLAPPAQTPSLGTTLCESLIHVLFTAWLRACQDTFPSPNLWKTLRELCCQWRHHPQLIQEWSQVMYSLTHQVIFHLYGSKHLSLMTPLPLQNPDFSPLVKEMNNSLAVQCWFRMLHTLGNPVDLIHSDIITGTPTFRKSIDPKATPPLLVQRCVGQLPVIFESAMTGVAQQVNLFLGRQLPNSGGTTERRALKTGGNLSRSSPSVRRREPPSKSTFFVPNPPSQAESLYVNISEANPRASVHFYGTDSSPLVKGGIEGIIGIPKANTLLHIFGNWLFEASSWCGKDRDGFLAKSTGTTSVSLGDISKTQGSTDVTSLQQRIRSYEAGRAEAIGSLCAIFSHIPCGEEILPVYLARFYHSLSVGLSYNPQTCSGQVLTRIILGSVSLLRKDLPGINVLVPYFLSSLEKILPPATPPFQCDFQVDKLRRASIQILLSIIPLPLHYIHLRIPDLVSVLQSVTTAHGSLSGQSQTFYSLKNSMINLLFDALQTEKDPVNMQMILQGLNVFIHDVILYEYSLSKMISQGEDGDRRTSTCTDDQDIISITNKPSIDSDLSSLFHEVAISAHKALVNWSNTNIVTLAALELLSGLARLQFDVLSHSDCRETVQWVCDFIESQSQQKPYLQTRSLHTSIVAGFTTLIVWIMEHPHLLAHEICLASILRVTEFGMTGTFSKQDDGTTVLKDEKELRPISGRVGEMAEFLLYCIMDKFGSFPSPCGAAASGSLLTEDELINQLPSSNKKPSTKFRYYLVDNSLVLGLLEGSYSEQEGALPTVTGILRGPASRHVWSLQLRHHPRTDTPSTAHLCSQTRPSPLDVPPSCPNLSRPNWPPAAKHSDLKLMQSIPTLDEVIDVSSAPLHREFSQLTEQQISVESNIQTKQEQLQNQIPFPDPSRALEPPEIKKDFDTARLFLSHLGLLNMEHLQLLPGQPSLMALDSTSLSFRSALAALDRLPTRYCDTVFILYCQKGQRNVEELLNDQLSLHNKPQEFIHFLNGLGWIVDPVKHPGFAGKLRPDASDEGGGTHNIGGGGAQIPIRPFPYYANAITEIAFVMPTRRPSANESVSSVRSVESSDSASDSFQSEPHPTPQPLPTWSAPSGSGVSSSQVHAGEGIKPIRSFISQSSAGGAGSETGGDTPRRRFVPPRDCAVLVVWLECYEDHLQFPVEAVSKLLYRNSVSKSDHHKQHSSASLPVIFVHRLSSGLYQITTRLGSSLGGPLIDGMVINRRCLSNLVRQTSINLCARHRMENDGYSPPHVKRKRKIEEMATMFARRQTVPEFYSELISESATD